MFKPQPEYKTNTGLVVYHLGQDTQCPTCGCHVAHTPQAIELPENLETCKGYFNKMMRQMADNYNRVQAINREAQRKRFEIDQYCDPYPYELLDAKSRAEMLNWFIQAYLMEHPGVRVADLELIQRRYSQTETRWFIQKKGE